MIFVLVKRMRNYRQEEKVYLRNRNTRNEEKRKD
jgi:hypothetical protein